MAISLKEAMAIYPFSRAKLIAGAAGIDRIVESANIQEVPDVDRWMHGGEILFSAGYAFRSVENTIHLMEHINALGAAGLALKPGQYFTQIPEDMIACAERLGMPLFELPEDLPYMDCIIPILERITEKQLSLLRRVESIYEQLIQSILREEGLDGICFTLNHVTGRPVFIFSNKGGSLLAYCMGEDGEYDGYGKKIHAQFERYCLGHPSPPLKHNQCNTLRFPDKSEIICIPIYVQQGGHLADLILDCSDCHLPDMDIIAFEHASSLIAIELLKEQALIEQEQKIREKLLEDLLMKRYGDRQMVYRRGLSVGIDLERPYNIFIIDPDDFEAYITQELSGYTEADIQRIKSQIHTLIRNGMQEFHGPYLLLNNSVSVVGLISVLHDEDVNKCRTAVEHILQRLRVEYPKLGFSAGIGRTKHTIQEADVSLQEARLALQCSRLVQFRSQNPIAVFQELGALTFLCELSKSQTLLNYYNEHIGKLLKYDEDHNAELIATLECYFRCNQNLRLTSEKLFIHKNSVIYRLKKVEDLIGLPLSDGLVAFDLQLCLQLKIIL